MIRLGFSAHDAVRSLRTELEPLRLELDLVTLEALARQHASGLGSLLVHHTSRLR